MQSLIIVFQLNKPLQPGLTDCDKKKCNVFYCFAFMLVYYVGDMLNSKNNWHVYVMTNEMHWGRQQLVCEHCHKVISPDI